jgi:hypothetical protein
MLLPIFALVVFQVGFSEFLPGGQYQSMILPPAGSLIAGITDAHHQP